MSRFFYFRVSLRPFRSAFFGLGIPPAEVVGKKDFLQSRLQEAGGQSPHREGAGGGKGEGRGGGEGEDNADTSRLGRHYPLIDLAVSRNFFWANFPCFRFHVRSELAGSTVG